MNEIDCICLGGAGIKNVISLGILDYYHNNSYLNNVKGYIGCSSGALICAFLCMSFSPSEIFTKIEEMLPQLTDIFKYTSIFNVLDNGYISYTQLNTFIEKPIYEKYGYIPTLRELYQLTGKTLVCTSFNYNKQKCVYISHEDKYFENIFVTDAIKMSCALPMVFERIIYKNELYIDGWIRDKFPLKYSCLNYNFVLSINMMLTDDISELNSDDNMKKILHNLYNNITTVYPESFEWLLHKSIQYHVPSRDVNMFDKCTDHISNMYTYGKTLVNISKNYTIKKCL